MRGVFVRLTKEIRTASGSLEAGAVLFADPELAAELIEQGAAVPARTNTPTPDETERRRA